MTRMIDASHGDFDAIYANFSWQLPSHFNIGQAICNRPKDQLDQVALYYENESGEERQYTFANLRRDSDRLANVLEGLGIKRGDRVATMLPQRVEAGLAHLGIYKIGAIALPLSVLFREEAIRHRINDSGARIVITNGHSRSLFEALRDDLPTLERIIDCDEISDAATGFWPLLDKASDQYQFKPTGRDDPALLIYTSGTTGPPKGALSAHRSLLGTLPGFELSHDLFPHGRRLDVDTCGLGLDRRIVRCTVAGLVLRCASARLRGR